MMQDKLNTKEEIQSGKNVGFRLLGGLQDTLQTMLR